MPISTFVNNWVPEGWDCYVHSFHDPHGYETYYYQREHRRMFCVVVRLFALDGYVCAPGVEGRGTFQGNADARKVIFDWLAQPGHPGHGIELR